jgi:hypothetical protein
MWPSERPDLKLRVIYATVYLVVAKLVLMLVPYGFKWATDALGGQLARAGWVPAAFLAPVMLVVAYNVFRVAQAGLNQLRDALFASVGQHAVRQLAYKTFVHMHGCRCASTWNGAPAACRASSSAAPRASRRSSASPS